MKYFTHLVIIIFWVCTIICPIYLSHWWEIRQNRGALHVFCWGDILHPHVVQQFEEKHKTKVIMSYYSSNEELFTKIKNTQGKGYDIIMPSDYMVEKMIKEGFIKKIKKEKLSFWHDVYPELLHPDSDPNNDYSIPFEWEIFGLGINKKFFLDQKTLSLKAIFNPENYSVVMTNDPQEALFLANLFLQKKNFSHNTSSLKEMAQVLKNQRPKVLAYSNFRAPYFLVTENVPLVASTSTYIYRDKKNFPHIELIIPSEGSFFSIENICISSNTDKEERVYDFINFVLSKESLYKHFDLLGSLPPLVSLLQALSDKKMILKEAFPKEKTIHRFKNQTSTREAQKIWMDMKAN